MSSSNDFLTSLSIIFVSWMLFLNCRNPRSGSQVAPMLGLSCVPCYAPQLPVSFSDPVWRIDNTSKFFIEKRCETVWVLVGNLLRLIIDYWCLLCLWNAGKWFTCCGLSTTLGTYSLFFVSFCFLVTYSQGDREDNYDIQTCQILQNSIK